MTRRLKYDDVKNYIESFGYKLLSKEYKNNRTKLLIRCPFGHEFNMSYDKFQSGHRCHKCNGGIKYDYEYIKGYIEKENQILLSKEYINAHKKLKIKCENGHIYEMTFNSFQQGERCNECNGTKKYDYEYVKSYINKEGYELATKEYENNITKLSLICPRSHDFEMSFSCFKNHNQRCPICKESKGERKITSFLNLFNIDFIRQYKFDGCKFYRCLPFDFYLPQYNCCIEFDGEQHYMIKKYFGGLDGFIDVKIRDTIKNKYCKDNNIKLIRIPYWEFNNIEEILEHELIL